jgi:phage tail tape-measure protein
MGERSSIRDWKKRQSTTKTHDPSAHPVGTGVGAATGAAAGAIVGALGGPAGAIVGGAIGAAGGAVAGHRAAREINPTAEDDYWREHYATREYVHGERPYTEYRPAYRYGWEARVIHDDELSFDDVESQLEQGWIDVREGSSLSWPEARSATRDAWERVQAGWTEDSEDEI